MTSNIEFREGLDDLAGHYRHVLQLLGEDPSREGLEKTPMRVAKAMQVLTRGYTQDPHKVLTDALFAEKYDQMVIVKDIDFFSMCEHHMLPFYGKAHVAYIPNGYITGLSKVARVVDIFSHRLQVQERLTQQIKDCIQDTLHPQTMHRVSTKNIKISGTWWCVPVIPATREAEAKAEKCKSKPQSDTISHQLEWRS